MFDVSAEGSMRSEIVLVGADLAVAVPDVRVGVPDIEVERRVVAIAVDEAATVPLVGAHWGALLPLGNCRFVGGQEQVADMA